MSDEHRGWLTEAKYVEIYQTVESAGLNLTSIYYNVFTKPVFHVI